MNCEEKVIRDSITTTCLVVSVIVTCCLMVVSTIMFNVVLEVSKVM